MLKKLEWQNKIISEERQQRYYPNRAGKHLVQRVLSGASRVFRAFKRHVHVILYFESQYSRIKIFRKTEISGCIEVRANFLFKIRKNHLESNQWRMLRTYYIGFIVSWKMGRKTLLWLSLAYHSCLYYQNNLHYEISDVNWTQQKEKKMDHDILGWVFSWFSRVFIDKNQFQDLNTIQRRAFSRKMQPSDIKLKLESPKRAFQSRC